MRALRYLATFGISMLAATATTAQTRPCSAVPPTERAAARAAGACRDVAPIIDAAPQVTDPASAAIPIASVVGLTFDDAKDRLARFQVRRSYRASAEPGGTVLEQQPAPPARMPAGALVRVILSDGTLRPPPKVSASEIDEPPSARAAAAPILQPAPPVASALPSVAATDPVRPATTARDSGSSPSTPVPSTPAPSSPVVEPDRLVVPNVLGMTTRNAQSRLGRYNVELRERASSAPAGHVIDQTPKASTRAVPGQAIRLTVSSGPASSGTAAVAKRAAAPPVSETFELANVTNRSIEDASSALAEFKVTRVAAASALPNGQVIGQSPAPGNMVKPGSTVTLQVSDGSLAAPRSAGMAPATAVPAATAAAPTTTIATTSSATTTAAPPAAATPAAVSPATTAPVTTPDTTAPAAATSDTATPSATTPDTTTVATAPAPLPPDAKSEAPAQTSATPSTSQSLSDFMSLGLAALLAVVLAAFLLARRNRGRGEAVKIEPTAIPPAEPAMPRAMPMAMAMAMSIDPEVRFAARLEAGEAQIEFTATSDTEADLDHELDAEEATIEHWGDRHG